MGESQPPRFYFGTNYGDQDGGRLAQRATVADRFADDERTVLLVSGQSANNHARTVSLVDESGLHTDNVHFSNATVAVYPTQDGVGKQYTISGPQQTTKESFIGNTSSIVFDGMDDWMKVTQISSAFDLGSSDFTLDAWFKIADTATAATNMIVSWYTDGTSTGNNQFFKIFSIKIIW